MSGIDNVKAFACDAYRGGLNRRDASRLACNVYGWPRSKWMAIMPPLKQAEETRCDPVLVAYRMRRAGLEPEKFAPLLRAIYGTRGLQAMDALTQVAQAGEAATVTEALTSAQTAHALMPAIKPPGRLRLSLRLLWAAVLVLFRRKARASG